MAVTATHLYTGMIDYWGGDGKRWDDNKGCLFAHYGAKTTLKEIVEEWVDDFNNGGDCESLWDDVTALDIKEAILGMLSGAGLADYHSGKVAECAAEYANCNGFNRCKDCGEEVGEAHNDNCAVLAELKEEDDYEEGADAVLEEDCDDEDDCNESPVCIILIEVDVCADCGKADDHYVDALCADCTKKHYPSHFDEDGEYIG